MDNSLPASVYLELAAPEARALAAAFSAAGIAVEEGLLVDEGPGEAARRLAEGIRESGADFLLVDAARFSAALSENLGLPRSVLAVVLLDGAEEERARTLLAAGAFDYLLRDGEGWEGRAAAYFHALSSLKRRFVGAFGALERRYEDLVHALPDIVYELDEDGRFTFVNNSIRLLGWDPAELAGRHFSVLLHEEDARVVDREEVLGMFRGARTGPALSPKLFNERRGLDRKTENLELRLRRKDAGGGDVIASVISYGEVTAAGEYSRPAGREGKTDFVGSVGVIRDITIRRKSEEMLRKLYQAVDQLSAGVLVVDRAFLVEYVNPAFLRISRREPQDLIGSPLEPLFDFGAGKVDELRALVREGFDFRTEAALRSPDGISVWTAFHASPVRAPSGDVTHAIVVCEDVSQRRAMEEMLRAAKEEAERADRAKSDFLASMGHELKSPVASILAAARLIEMGGGDPEKRAASIIHSADGLLAVLGDILDFVRFETGTGSLRRLAFPLGGFITRSCEPFRAVAGAKGLSFEIGRVPEEIVHSDPDRLGRALAALVDNAVAYTEKGGVRIEAAVERREGNVPHLVVRIADTGLGIAPEDQGRIFAPFVQLASPFTKRGGAGIGLSLARNIVRALGGEIRLESSPGRGSVFTVLVPAGEPSPAPAAASAAVAEGKPWRLLVVDDNEVNLEYMSAILRNAGHFVDVASSGAAALASLEARIPDAAILDIQMPGMSGLELGRRVRGYAGDRYDPGLPLFALTAFDAEEVLRSGVDFDGVFAKPVDVAKLLDEVERAIVRREAEPEDSFERRWAGRPGTGAVLLARAEAEVPALLDAAATAVEKGAPDHLRAAAQSLGWHFNALGASKAEGALRRLALALGQEESAVLACRARRIALVWEGLRARARAGLASIPEAGDGQGGLT